MCAYLLGHQHGRPSPTKAAKYQFNTCLSWLEMHRLLDWGANLNDTGIWGAVQTRSSQHSPNNPDKRLCSCRLQTKPGPPSCIPIVLGVSECAPSTEFNSRHKVQLPSNSEYKMIDLNNIRVTQNTCCSTNRKPINTFTQVRNYLHSQEGWSATTYYSFSLP